MRVIAAPLKLLRPWIVLAVCAGAISTAGPAAATDPEQPSIRADLSGIAGTNGWYRSDVTVRWDLSDPTGITSSDGCGPRTLKDETPGTTFRCTATNRANISRTVSVTVKIDKTPPVLALVTVESGDGADRIAWRSSSDADVAVVKRVARGAATRVAARVFSGPGRSFTDHGIRNGREYWYAVRSYDQAGNPSRQVSVHALPKVLVLERLPYVPRAAAIPVLRWRPVRGAGYYHVQLFRRGERILAAWPKTPQLPLESSWTWDGRRHRLAPGSYRWYVWSGFGPRSTARYFRLGTAAFTVAKD